MTYPITPGHKGTVETGREAAMAFAPKLGRRQAEALAALENLGVASAEEVAEATKRHWYLTRPRLSELAAQGLVTDSGQRGYGALGGKVIRWRPTTSEERAIHAAQRAAEREHGEGQ